MSGIGLHIVPSIIIKYPACLHIACRGEIIVYAIHRNKACLHHAIRTDVIKLVIVCDELACNHLTCIIVKMPLIVGLLPCTCKGHH